MLADTEDDYVGGALITGTVAYYNVQARLEQEPANLLLNQQGIETVHIYSMTIIPGTLTVYERDEVQIVQPLDHHYYGQRFRVRGVRYSSHNPRDPRNYIMLSLNRSDRMHRQQ
jgi:hypothetical protein